MDPVVDQRPVGPKKSQKIVIAGVITVVIFTALAVAGYLWWGRSEPERRLYGAIENLLKTSYINRDYTVENSDGRSILITSKSDFSVPAQLKSEADYAYDRGPKDSKITGNLIVLADKTYGKFTQLPNNLLTNTTVNQWYDSSRTDAGIPIDYLGLSKTLNSSLGQVVIGNYSSNERSEIVNKIRTSSVYTIIEMNQSQNKSILTVKIDYSKFNQISNAIKQITEINQAAPLTKQVTNAIFTIDNQSNDLVSIKEVSKNTDKTSTQTTILFSYPTTPPLIKKPL